MLYIRVVIQYYEQKYQSFGSALSGFALKRRPIKHLLPNVTQEPNTLCVGVLKHAHIELSHEKGSQYVVLFTFLYDKKCA